MKQLSHLLLCALVVATLGCGIGSDAPTTPAPETDSAATAIDFQPLLDDFLANYPETRGVYVHIEAPEQGISWSGAAGFDSLKNQPLHPSDPLLIASNTKTYIAATMVRLHELDKLNIHDAIAKGISAQTDSLLRSDGYQTDSITIAHLLSHTSGIVDYTDSEEFLDRILNDTEHYWTRDEQIALGIRDFDPLGPPGFTFHYSDLNYLLCTEIIESVTGKPFHTAVRDVVRYEDAGLHETWWNLLENPPANMRPLVQQFAAALGGDSYVQHGSIDLYGGGGIACTAKDLALFSQHVFEGNLFDNASTRELMLTEMPTQDSIAANYYLGIGLDDVGGMRTYGHGGFWGTIVKYFPDQHLSVALFVRERDGRRTSNELFEAVVRLAVASENAAAAAAK